MSSQPDRAPVLPGLVLIILISLVWGLNWPSMRTAVAEISPWSFRAVCLIVGTSTLLMIAVVRRTSLRVSKDEILPLIAVGLFNVAAYHLLTAFGLTKIEAGRGVILGFTFPLWSVLFGAFILKERITPARAVALVLGLGGMALLIGPEITKVGGSPLGGMLLIGSAISWAVATMIVKSRTWKVEMNVLVTWQVVIGCVPVLAGALYFEPIPDFTLVSDKALIALFYSSAIAVAVGQTLWFRMLRTMPSAVASIGTLATPVVGVWSSALLLGEAIGWREVAALVLVVCGLALVLVGAQGWATIRRFFARSPSQ